MGSLNQLEKYVINELVPQLRVVLSQSEKVDVEVNPTYVDEQTRYLRDYGFDVVGSVSSRIDFDGDHPIKYYITVKKSA